MTDPTTQISDDVYPDAINAVQSILNVDPISLSGVLDEYGISTVDLPDLDHAEPDHKEFVEVASAAHRAISRGGYGG